MSRTPVFAVVGAGASGLACAHRLSELSRKEDRPAVIRVFDSSDRAGGVVSSRTRDGFLWEEGPDCYLTEKPAALNLCRRLGLGDDIVGTNPLHQKSFIVHHGRLHETPEGFYLLAPTRLLPLVTTPLFSWGGKLRMAMEMLLPRVLKNGGDISLADFVRRRLGVEALERAAQPMVAGIYSADPEELSLRATFPRFLELEKRYGSVIRGLLAERKIRRGLNRGVSGPRYSLFATLKGGLSKMVDALVAALPSDALRLRTTVDGLRPSGNGWELSVQDGPFQTDAVCLAIPAPKARDLAASTDPEAASLLDSVPYGDAVTLHLAYRREDVSHPLDGFGFVVPSRENRSLSGCSFANVKFPHRAPEGFVLLRAFQGGVSQKDGDWIESVRRDLRDFLGIQAPPLWTSVRRFSASMPRYRVGHLDRMARLNERLARHPGLTLAGNGLDGIGLPDCVRLGETAAETMWDHAKKNP